MGEYSGTRSDVLPPSVLRKRARVTQKLDLLSGRAKCLKGAYWRTQIIIMIKFTFWCKSWGYLLRMTMFGQFWWYLWSVISHAVVMVYKMSLEFSTAPFSGCYRLSASFSVLLSSSLLGLVKQGGKQWNGEFPPCSGVGEVIPSIIYVGRNSSTLKIYFSLCVNVFAKKKKKKKKWHKYRFISFRSCVKPENR